MKLALVLTLYATLSVAAPPPGLYVFHATRLICPIGNPMPCTCDGWGPTRPSDVRPIIGVGQVAGYVAGPYNSINGEVATVSQGAGYWLAQTPVHCDAASNICTHWSLFYEDAHGRTEVSYTGGPAGGCALHFSGRLRRALSAPALQPFRSP